MRYIDVALKPQSDLLTRPRCGSQPKRRGDLFTPASFRRRVFLGGAPSGLHPRWLQINVPDRYYPPRVTANAPALSRSPGDCCDRKSCMRARFRLYNEGDGLVSGLECNP
jgi:hypothetical protein